jgi:hypothetical protein
MRFHYHKIGFQTIIAFEYRACLSYAKMYEKQNSILNHERVLKVCRQLNYQDLATGLIFSSSI